MGPEAKTVPFLLLLACGEPEPCDGTGPRSLSVVPNAGDGTPLADGGELPVFPPPQGGVFAELDIEVGGLSEDEVAPLRARVTEVGADLLADSVASRFPTLCGEDGQVRALDLPVGFLDQVEDPLQLDGKSARVEIEVGPSSDPVAVEYEVTIVATDYAAPGN